MKVALALTGQFRCAQYPNVGIPLYHNLVKRHDIDIYVSTWDRRGISAAFNGGKPWGDPNDLITPELLRNTYGDKLVDFRIQNYNTFMDTYGAQYSYAINFPKSKNSVQCLYQLHCARQLITKQYDLVIWSRPDFQYWAEVPACVFEDPSKIWHQNIEPHFYRDRVYDVWVATSQPNFEHMANIFNDYHTTFNRNENLSLQRDDTPRLLYCHMVDNYKIETVPYIFGDICRV